MRLSNKLVTSAKLTGTFVLLVGLVSGIVLVQNNQNIFERAAPRKGADTPPRGPVSGNISYGGVYPFLSAVGTPENLQDECCNEVGIGGAVYWAGSLWSITYPSHFYKGSYDHLYKIDPVTKKAQVVVYGQGDGGNTGGTHAGRMIHVNKQTGEKKLLLGQYIINQQGNVVTIPSQQMQGRITAIARHLTDWNNKAYYYTMEQGLYEVDINSSPPQITTLRMDDNQRFGRPINAICDFPTAPGCTPLFDGAHGKAAYKAAFNNPNDVRILAGNNGSNPPDSRDYDAGGLGEYKLTGEYNPGESSNWQTVDVAKYTDITSKRGIEGGELNDPIFALGLDKRSTVLNVLSKNNQGLVEWKKFRLPKGTYTYDESTGWFMEWPRIHDFTNTDMLVDGYGLFYRMNKDFSITNPTPISPFVRHLSIINEVAKDPNSAEYAIAKNDLNTNRNFSFGNNNQRIITPMSNFIFATESDIANWGPKFGVGGPWFDEPVTANIPSDPYLVDGFKNKIVHFVHNASSIVRFQIQVSQNGLVFSPFSTVLVPPNVGDSEGYAHIIMPPDFNYKWMRFVTDKSVSSAKIFVAYTDTPRSANSSLFSSLVSFDKPARVESQFLKIDNDLYLRSKTINGDNVTKDSNYKLSALLEGNNQVLKFTNGQSLPVDQSDNLAFTVLPASVRVQDPFTNRPYHLPKSGGNIYDSQWAGEWPRAKREVAADRALYNLHGTFYEAPRSKHDRGINNILPVATHNKRISDFISWRGMILLSGNRTSATGANIIKSDDSNNVLWAGNLEQLWEFGTPVGGGGPWSNTSVNVGDESEPYLIAGYYHKDITITHNQSSPQRVQMLIDLDGTGRWYPVNNFHVLPGQNYKYTFPEGFYAHWVKFKLINGTNGAKITTNLIYSHDSHANRSRYCSPDAWLNQDTGISPSIGTIISFDHAVFPVHNGTQRMHQTALVQTSSGSKVLYMRRFVWNNGQKKWDLVQGGANGWNLAATNSELGAIYQYLPTDTISFDQEVLDSGRIKQTMITSDGKSLRIRDLNYNAGTGRYSSNPNWSTDTGSMPDSTKTYISYDHMMMPNGQLRQLAMENDGKTFYERYLKKDPNTTTNTGWVDFTPWVQHKYNSAYITFDGFVSPDNSYKQTIMFNYNQQPQFKNYIRSRYFDYDQNGTMSNCSYNIFYVDHK